MSYKCTFSIPAVGDFSQSTLITLRVINSCIALLNIFGNGFLIYALRKTSQTTSFSLQLIVLMSSSDCINGIVALVLTNILLLKTYDSYCFLKIITQFLHTLFLSFSFTTALLIAIDRYLHIKYLQRYPLIVTKRRGRIIALGTFLCHTVVAFVSSVPLVKYNTKFGKLLTISGATLSMITISVLYYKTMKAINSRVLSSTHNLFISSTMVRIKTLANVALSISICMALLLTPYVIGVAIHDLSNGYNTESKAELATFRWFAYLGSHANGVCSCIIFIAQNKPVKRLIKNMVVALVPIWHK